jgi:hypothetical protein
MPERPLKSLRKSGAFQAEYEGSIPFTRSISNFNDLSQNPRLLFQHLSDTFLTSQLKPRKICECFQSRSQIVGFMNVTFDELGSFVGTMVAPRPDRF